MAHKPGLYAREEIAMATMEHKGFMAKIDYDADIDSFLGCVVNVSSPITFYGKTTAEPREEFARSVDAWLEVCRERGLEPEKPYSGRLTVRMTPEIHRMIASAAAVSGKSLNAWVVDALKESAAHA